MYLITFHFVSSSDGVPGVVMADVEPFTTTSVRIRWDPPSQPNDDIELLDYDVYYDQRAISSPKSLDITGRQPDETRKWNERSVIIDNLDFDDSVVAVVVARSPQGLGAQPQPDQATVGFTFGAGEYTLFVFFCVHVLTYGTYIDVPILIASTSDNQICGIF